MNGSLPTLLSLGGMVAAAHPLASAAGVEILHKGGNAFDAAAATAAALNVVEPYMSGLAGMGIAICRIATENKVRVLNFESCFPSNFDPETVVERLSIRRGAYGVGLPGSLAGWAELAGSYGRLPFGDTLLPAIRLAHDGFGLSELNVKVLNDAREQLKEFPELYPDWADVYEHPMGGAFTLGAMLRQPRLGETFEAISKSGIGHLYGGPIGKAIVNVVRDKGGCLTERDIEEIAPQWQEPLLATYRGHTVFTTPAPSNGFQLLTSLKLFEHQTPDGVPDDTTEKLDILFRCLRIAARTRIENCESGYDADFAGRETIDALAKKLYTDAGSFGPTEYNEYVSSPDRPRENTTSFTVGDKEGNLVTIIQSLGQYFGSGVVVKEFGVALNDQLHYGNLSWRLTGEKRPVDLPTAPAIVEVNGKGRLAYGTPGGFGIPQTQAQALLYFTDHGMRLQQAIDAPRARVLPGRTVAVESRLISGRHVDALQARGHELRVEDPWTKLVGGMHGIFQHAGTGLLEGAADRRRDGYVAIQ